MTVKITSKNIPRNVFKQIRKEFAKSGTNARSIKKQIIEDMAAGVSPVEGKRWAKYSQSYKDVIRGKVSFRKIGGKVVKLNKPDSNVVGKGKSVSPVNLRLSGGLWKSLKVSTTGRLIIVAFEDFLALVHNSLGASKKKVIRRMLPTEPNERFNEGITQVIEKGVKKAIDIVVNRINRQ